MSDKDTRLLAEKYSLILEGKALTPEQIAKNAKPAGSSKGGGKAGLSTDKGGLATSNKEGTGAEQPSTNEPDNIDQDNKDTTVEDPYVLKETDDKETPVEAKEEEPAAEIQGENISPEGGAGGQPQKDPEAIVQDLVYHAAMELTGTLEDIGEQLSKFPPEVSRHAKVDLVMALKRIVDDFKFGRLPNQVAPNAQPQQAQQPTAPIQGTPGNTDSSSVASKYRM